MAKRFLLAIAIIFSASFLMAQDNQFDITGDTITTCGFDEVLINAGPGYTNYLWTQLDGSDSQTGQLLVLTESGRYKLERDNEEADTVYINLINYQLAPQNTTVCSGSHIELQILDPNIHTFLWEHNDETGLTTIARPTNNDWFKVTLSNDEGSCYDSIQVMTKKGLDVTLNKLNDVCIDGDDGQMHISTHGGVKPYEFLWNDRPSALDSINASIEPGDLHITITDSELCRFDTVYKFEAIPPTKVTILVEPDDKNIFIQNPTIYLDFEIESDAADDVELANWEWDFGDPTPLINPDLAKQRNPSYTYENILAYLETEGDDASYILRLEFEDEFGCKNDTMHQLDIKEADVFIPNAVAPNSINTANNIFGIYNRIRTYDEDNSLGPNGPPIDYEYFSVELSVHNRFGRLVYSDKNYKGDWRCGGLKDGVYYYIIKLTGKFQTETKKGVFHLFNDLSTQ